MRPAYHLDPCPQCRRQSVHRFRADVVDGRPVTIDTCRMCEHEQVREWVDPAALAPGTVVRADLVDRTAFGQVVAVGDDDLVVLTDSEHPGWPDVAAERWRVTVLTG